MWRHTPQVERLLRQIDLNSDEGIAYDEFLAAMLTWRTVRSPPSTRSARDWHWQKRFCV